MKYMQLILGIGLTAYAAFSAVVLGSPHFYTYFTVGTFLLFDGFDYLLTGQSILRFLFKKENHKQLVLFILVSSILCFLVDYIYGVRLTRMWTWPAYTNIHFLRMYILMNPTFILGCYELYKLLKHLLKNRFQDHLLFPKTAKYFKENILGKYGLIAGSLFLLFPLYVLIVKSAPFIEYVMLFPFISVLLIPDSITFIMGKEPFISKVIGFNPLEITALFLTHLITSLITEFLNLFANEWVYMRIPFMDLNLAGIPVAVFLGWIPLVIGTISIVTMIKQLPK